MATGEIRDFRNSGQGHSRGEVKILGAHEVTTPLERPNDDAEPENRQPEIDVRLHEEVQREGEGKVRISTPDGIDLRIRHGKTQQEWDQVKRGEDE